MEQVVITRTVLSTRDVLIALRDRKIIDGNLMKVTLATDKKNPMPSDPILVIETTLSKIPASVAEPVERRKLKSGETDLAHPA